MARSYEEIHADILDASEMPTRLAITPDSYRQIAQRYERLSALWQEVAELAQKDGSPPTAVMSALLLADQYRRDAKVRWLQSQRAAEDA